MKKHNLLKNLSRFLLWSHVMGVVGFYLVLWLRSTPAKESRVKKSASKPENPEQSANCPLVSIIVPARNEERNIRRCVESLLEQSYSNFEVIVVDDGNDDETVSVCKQFSVEYLKVGRPQSPVYRNPALPMNMGLRKAIGDIVILQNAECKHVDPDTIEKLVSQVSGENAVFARVISMGQDGKPVKAYPIYCGKENPRPLFFCGAVKRHWFEKLRGFDEDYINVCYEDDDFADRLKKEGVRFVFTDVEVHHQFHPYLGHIDTSPSKALYMKKSTDMALGRIGTARNLDHEWGILGSVSTVIPPPPPPPIPVPSVVEKVNPAVKKKKDSMTIDWWDTHPRQ